MRIINRTALKTLLILIVCLIAGMQSVLASTIYSYTSSTSGSYASIGSNMTATGLSRVNGASAPGSPCGSGFSSTNFSSTTTYSSSLQAIEWSVTPSSGYYIQVSSFQAGIRRSGTGPAYARFAYSTDNGSTWNDKGSNDAPNNASCGSMATASWSSLSVKSTGTIIFRIYVFGASGTSGTFQLLNVSVDGTVAVAGYANDASISAIRNPASSLCEGTQDVLVDISNPGTNALSSATVKWSVNGVKQTDYSYSNTLAAGTKDSAIKIGSFYFKAGSDTIRVWTTNPNKTTDGNTANDSFKIIITVYPLPGALVGDSTAICLGDTAYLGDVPVSGSKYSWTSVPAGFTSNIAGPMVMPKVTTTYYLTETNITGCQLTNSVKVTVNPVPKPNAGNDTAICEGNSVTLGTTGIKTSSYFWVDRTGTILSYTPTPTMTPKATTTYYLIEMNASGCYGFDSVKVTVNPLPKAITGANAAICIGDNITIGAKGDSTNKYAWTSKPAGYTSTKALNTLSPSKTTTYYLAVVSDKGCKKADSATITVNPLPVIAAGKDSSICNGLSIKIGNNTQAGNTYIWSSKPTGFSSTLANPSVQPVVTTRYYVQGKSAAGCKSNDSLKITVVDLPKPDAGKDSIICQGNSAGIGQTAVAATTYQWASKPAGFSSKNAKETVNPTITTTYFLTAANILGCTVQDSVTVIVNNRPTVSITAPDTILCKGDSIKINTGTGTGLQYAWMRNGKLISKAGSAGYYTSDSGQYSVKVTNNKGCNNTSRSVKVIEYDYPVKPVITMVGTQLTSSATSNNQWYKDGVKISGATAQTFSPVQSGKYTVEVSNAGGCTTLSDAYTYKNVGIEPMPEAKLELYPNPTSGNVNIKFEGLVQSSVRLRLIDMNGRVMIDQLQSAGAEGSINMDLKAIGAKQGMYILMLQSGNIILKQPLVVLP